MFRSESSAADPISRLVGVNAERLHAIAKALKDELDATQAVPLTQQLLQGLQSIDQQPGQPAPQQSVSEARAQLEARLAEAASNHHSPAWRNAVEELGVADLLGDRLGEQIEGIFDRNEITPAAAASELEPIATSLTRLDNALDQLLQGFDFFGIPAEELEPGEFEIGFLIPREAVEDELGELGLEFINVKRILGPFQELATGTREDLEVRSISSSAFQVFLQSAPAVALMFATALERLISSYEKVMNIRVAYQTLKESNVEQDALAAVEASAEKKIGEDINEMVEQTLAEADDLEPARCNELRKELTDSLNALANRIDRGYSMEVRAGPLPEPDDGEEEDESEDDKRLARIVEQVLAKQERLKFTNTSGAPILQLPEPTDSSATDPE
jgi:hypothetical protein